VLRFAFCLLPSAFLESELAKVMVGVEISPTHPLGPRQRPEQRMDRPLGSGILGEESHRPFDPLQIRFEEAWLRAASPRIGRCRSADAVGPVNREIETGPFHDCAPEKRDSLLPAPPGGELIRVGQVTEHLVGCESAPTPFYVHGQMTEASDDLGLRRSISETLHGPDRSAESFILLYIDRAAHAKLKKDIAAFIQDSIAPAP
jgi:hypothetical protein